MIKFYFIAGEASGDLHGSNLMKSMKQLNTEIDFRFWGGDEMEKVAGKAVKHIKDLAFMGFVEVVMNLRTITRNLSFCKQDIERYNPDALVLVDYPGFNLRIASWAKSKGIKVFYYISPQVWAWKEGRVKKIKETVDKMFCILPFEKPFYAVHGFEVEFLGHPLLDAIDQFRKARERDKAVLDFGNKPILALLPGSRKQEIKAKLPIMLKAVKGFHNYQIIICGSPNLDERFYDEFTSGVKEISVVKKKTYDVLDRAHMALVTSGTATLETALFKVPQVVCYKGSYLSYQIAKRLIKVKFISLVNLIMDREVVKELIQDDLTADNLIGELKNLEEEHIRNKVLEHYRSLIQKLGGGGASDRVAEKILAGFHE